ncbi:MAG TPA: class II fructose-bisphosphate aldolase [Bryobacteraceae bacterium]|nr:class II fructose-bisphosphate aldolase [Bryobacteraceae bacterium]
MNSLLEVLRSADRARTAIGHFNISDLAALKAVSAAARELKVPVVVGLSEGERAFMGVRQSAAAVRAVREEYGSPIFLNADHTHSLASAEEAVRAGYDSVVFDRSELPMADNIAETRDAVAKLKAINPAVVIEGEIGEIGIGSEIHEFAPQRMTVTTPEDALAFVSATGVDVLAPSVGNMHGLLREMVQGKEKKRLHVQLISDIKTATGVPLTLHGGSGTKDEDVAAAIHAGITQIHINTEVRLAWRRGLEAALSRDRDQLAPYKILPEAVKSIQDVVRERLRLFSWPHHAAPSVQRA